MKKYINRSLWLLTVFFCFAMAVTGQTNLIQGKVTDSGGEPLPGVSIVIKGTSTGTITDVDGNFQVEASPSDVLQFSFIGFDKLEVPVGDDTSFRNISMQESVVALDEVVAIGYGKAKKSDLTSSITSVKGEEMKTMTVGNPVQALQGKAPGVQVVAGGGQPGAAPKVLIRGFTSLNLSTDPLYVVDGVPMGSNLNFLNTNEIESMEVLKDASASAIYGSRASNGVVLITTKRGTAGKTQFSADLSYGFQVFEKPFDMANAAEYGRIMNQSLVNGGLEERFPDPSSLGEGTDWWGEGVNKVSPQRNFSFQASGGNEMHKFAVSLNYYDQESFYNSGDWKKFTARLSSDWDFADWISAGVMLNPRREVWKNTPDWYQDYLLIDPVTPVLRPEAEREGLNEFSIYQRSYYTYTWNPIARDARNFGEGGYYALGTNAYAEMRPVEGLEYRTQISGDFSFNHSDDFVPDFVIDGAHEKNEINYVYRNHDFNSYWNWTNTLTYSLETNGHNASLMGGATMEKWEGRYIDGTKEGIPNNSDVLREIDAATENPEVNGNSWGTSIQSYLGRLSYNYMNRYYLTATYRMDGSSKFLENNKWASFPSASVAWRISDEAFMSGIDFIDDWKLRAGWGRLGNQNLPANVYTSGIGQGYYVLGPGQGALVNTTYPSSMKNEDIKWETVEDINLGTDFTLFRSQIDGSLEYYQKKTKDMIFQLPYPNYSGYPNDAQIWSNVGSMKSEGLEMALNYHNHNGRLKYDVGITLTTVAVEATDLPNATPVIYGDDEYTKTVEGDVPGYFYGYKTDGIFQTWFDVNAHASEHGSLIQPQARPGDIKFADVDGDGSLTGNDRTKIGSPWPDFTGGFNLNMAYDNFDLVANVYVSVGNDLVNWTKGDLYNTQGSDNNVISGILGDAWDGEGSTNQYPMVSHTDLNQNFGRFSDFYVEDGSFMRLKNIQLGYSLPQNVLTTLGLTKCRFYVSGQNILTVTDYSGVDPEVAGDVLNFGFAGWTYPVLPTYLIGANITF
ncbi:SusC/RagA family TonB-linked outer membrane protein [Marinilabilia rubra]|uniref:SusC/RagA family TonB-linked outer membrane protein n=1 Tax=Marinilabilia rubra TaxID=2162893 RepID=A0A2U2B605_9BACT|nr:TonB-dependent receptor [Marinilabilia rubra]PWD98472.1 SusC/RagA family TonB-linked outer membrane protein [Marinilabilia rubra]